MPKIKFSALVSGMSGKSQGSVFGTNQGGSYFRNNTSKVKTKNALNGRRKSLFSEVAGFWRNLSAEQQEAWRGAVNNFVVQNSFGDNRTPTGFEVFTRLNNVRLEQGLPMLMEPPTPRALPSLNDLELNIPDQFLYLPNQGVTNYDISNPSVKVEGTAALNLDTTTVQGNQFIMAQYYFPSNIQDFSFVQSDKGLFAMKLASGEYAQLEVVGSNSTIQKLRLTIPGGSGTIIVITDTAVIDILKPFTVGVFFGSGAVSNIQLWLNGQLLTTTNSTAGTYTASTFDQILLATRDTSILASKIIYSDLRLFEGVLDSTSHQLATLGYVLGTEMNIYPMYSISPTLNVSNFNTGLGGDLHLTGTTGVVNVLTNFPQNRIPLLELSTTSNGTTGMSVYIYATPCISFGRTTSTPNKKLLGVFPYNSETTWEVQDQWQTKYGAFSPNGYIQLFVQVSDSTTGVNNAALIKPPKRKRFKAGYELSGAVN